MGEPKYYDELPTYIMHSDGEFVEGTFKAVDGSGNSLTIGTEKDDTGGKLTIEGADKAEFNSTYKKEVSTTGTSKTGSFISTIGEIAFKLTGMDVTLGEEQIKLLAVTFIKDNDGISFELPTIETIVKIDNVLQQLAKNIKDGTGEGAIIEGLISDDTVNEASGVNAHAEGGTKQLKSDGTYRYFKTVASGEAAHAEGRGSTASGVASHAEGDVTTASEDFAHAEGDQTTASGYGSHSEGCATTASGYCSHTEGDSTEASDYCSHAEGDSTKASGYNSHAQNSYTIAQGVSQTTIGEYNVAQGTAKSRSDTDYAFIIGNGTADDARSNAFAVQWDGKLVSPDGTAYTPWQLTNAKDGTGAGAVIEGTNCTASGGNSHAEGYNSTASGNNSHAEGGSTASGVGSHAEGFSTKAVGMGSHAEGLYSESNAYASHSQNGNTIANGKYQTVLGKFNEAQGDPDSVPTDTDYAVIIGNGTGANARSNALAVRWDGAIVLANGTVLTVEQLAKVANLT